ncbi:MAG: hypothetical protein ABF380_12965, partial [Akkermansiaceae bacterium]
SGCLDFFFCTADQDNDSLIGRGHIEPEAEVWKIWNCRFSGLAFGFIVIGDFIEGGGKITTENLVGATAAS